MRLEMVDDITAALRTHYHFGGSRPQGSFDPAQRPYLDRANSGNSTGLSRLTIPSVSSVVTEMALYALLWMPCECTLLRSYHIQTRQPLQHPSHGRLEGCLHALPCNDR